MLKVIWLTPASLGGRALRLLIVLLSLTLVSCSTSEPSDQAATATPGELNVVNTAVPASTNPPEPVATESSTATPIPATPILETPLSGFEAMIAASRNKLLGTTWVLSGFEPLSGLGSGAEIPVEDFQTYSLTFAEDGTFAFTANCNSGISAYSIPDPNSISLDIFVPSAPRADLKEPIHEYLDALAHIEDLRFENNDETLFLRGTEGSVTYQRLADFSIPTNLTSNPIDIDLEQIQLDTQGLYESWTAHLIPASNFVIGEDRKAEGLPEHIEITFDGTDPYLRTPADPIIYIIPTTAYREMWESNNNTCVTKVLSFIRDSIRGLFIGNSTARLVLPFEQVVGFNDFTVEVDTALANGVSFIGRYVPEPVPLSNDGLRFIYQGFTNDGKFLVSFFAPISHSDLPSLEEVPASDFEFIERDYAAYMEENSGLSGIGWLPDGHEVKLHALVLSLSLDGSSNEDSPVIGYNWQWHSTVNEDGTEVMAKDPTLYSLSLNEDGTYEFVADCNSGSGMYELLSNPNGKVNGGLILTPDTNAITQNNCDAGSLSSYFLNTFGSLFGAEYFMEEGNMVLYSIDNAILRFQRQD